MKRSLLLASLALLTGCGNVRYVAQAARGELSLLQRARPISKVLKDESTPPQVRYLLSQVGQVKRFGEQQGLRPTTSYRRFTQLDGPAVVWVVSASEPLRFQSTVWRFPFVGEVPYLGWFDRQDAQAFAQELKTRGLDVDVRGAAAYSTLGWFNDPLLSTMLPEGDGQLGELVNVVLHESVHATLYIPSETHFNESLASFVSDHLTASYLKRSRGEDSVELGAYQQGRAGSTLRTRRLHEVYASLEELYQSSRTDDEKRREKARILEAARAELRISREINNATLVQYRTYATGYEDLERLYVACGSSWQRFFASLRGLGRESFSRADQQELGSVLSPLVARGCPAPGAPPG